MSRDRGRFRPRRLLPLRLALRVSADDLAETVLTLRTLRALDTRAANYPVHRVERCAVRRPVAELLDDIALQSGFAAHRLSESSLLLDDERALMSVPRHAQVRLHVLHVRDLGDGS